MSERIVRGACPLDCPDTCSWLVTVKDGRAIQLRGDRNHPITRGSLCNKLDDFVAHTQSPERLLFPLRRVGPKGSAQFVRISWDEALATIASRLREVRDRYGGEAIWPYSGTGTMGLLQGAYGPARRFWNVLGASQHRVTICTIAGGVGTGFTLGRNRVGMDPETLRFAKLIILWGTNTLSTNAHLWHTISAARAAGAYLVVIDPVRTRTAAAADLHLAPIPGTDAALALALLNVVVAEGAEDHEFIAQHTLGWPEFRERIVEFSPERAAAVTGLPVDDILMLGRRVAHSRPTGIRMAMGVQRHGGGGMAVRTITCIPGVTGDWRYPGGGAAYDTRDFFRGNLPALLRDDLLEKPVRSLAMTRLADGLLQVDEPPVKALFVCAANPVASSPDQIRIRQGLARDDLFTVVVEHFLTDTATYADVILPSTMQFEHADLHTAYGHIYVSWNEPAVQPPGECLSHLEIFRRLARTLGLTEPCLFDSDEDLARQVLASDEPAMAGITLEALKEKGWLRLNYPDPFVPFANGFLTPSGKLEFRAERMLEVGLDPLAGYTPPNESACASTESASRYRLALVAAADHYFLNSMFANVSRQTRRAGPAVLLMHPEDARERALETGAEVRVLNDRGAFSATLQVSDRVRRGVVATTKGRWPSQVKGGANPNATVAERDADMGGGAVFHDNMVDVERSS
ncbi:MAG TPA: molybdopterin-dependent oxidoreductase [Polyangiaceae bacterium]|nr:molybdopterin-dependent oxidoreductase [Polyangiaceae bacterium]